MTLSTLRKAAPPRKNRWFEKLMAAIALLNFCLVLFDLSYIPGRDFYLLRLPPLTVPQVRTFTEWYGQQFKGIEPNRDTEAYLIAASQLEQQIATEGLSAPASIDLLTELRSRSTEIIDEDPFQTADKSGTLERIKYRMRNHVERVTGQEYESAKQAFSTFWSEPFLQQAGVNESIGFFNESIEPLLETNYFRRIGFNGAPLNEFIRIDVWFIGLFGIEFLLRTWYLSRRSQGASWLDAMLWRWYDLLLLIPFSLFAPSWALLRLIPVTIRINQSNLIDLEPLRNRIARYIIANFAIEITEIVVVQIIEQLQNLIRQGDLTRALLRPETTPRYIGLNDVDEIKTIADRLTTTLVHQVIPQVRPDIEAVLHHTIANTLSQSAVYRNMQRVPGLSSVPEQLTQQIAANLYEALYGALAKSIDDETGAKLTEQLIGRLGSTFRSEIQKQRTGELEALLTIWLDEVKINYVKRLAEEDVDRLREQSQRLYELTQGRKP